MLSLVFPHIGIPCSSDLISQSLYERIIINKPANKQFTYTEQVLMTSVAWITPTMPAAPKNPASGACTFPAERISNSSR